MPVELILGQKPIMLIEESILSWVTIPWREEISIEQHQRQPEDIEKAAQRLKEGRQRNKVRFDKTHRIQPRRR